MGREVREHGGERAPCEHQQTGEHGVPAEMAGWSGGKVSEGIEIGRMELHESRQRALGGWVGLLGGRFMRGAMRSCFAAWWIAVLSAWLLVGLGGRIAGPETWAQKKGESQQRMGKLKRAHPSWLWVGALEGWCFVEPQSGEGSRSQRSETPEGGLIGRSCGGGLGDSDSKKGDSDSENVASRLGTESEQSRDSQHLRLFRSADAVGVRGVGVTGGVGSVFGIGFPRDFSVWRCGLGGISERVLPSFGEVASYFEEALGAPGTLVGRDVMAFVRSDPLDWGVSWRRLLLSRGGGWVHLQWFANDDFGMSELRDFFEAPFFDISESESFYRWLGVGGWHEDLFRGQPVRMGVVGMRDFYYVEISWRTGREDVGKGRAMGAEANRAIGTETNSASGWRREWDL